MQKNTVVTMLLVVLALSLAAGTSLRAADKPSSKIKRVQTEVAAQKAEALTRNQVRLPMPEIRDDFSGIKAVWMGGLAGSITDTTAPFRITFDHVPVGNAGFDIQVVDNEGNVRSDYAEVRVRPRPAVMRLTD